VRKRISVALVTALLGAATGATGFAAPSLAASNIKCSTRAEGNFGGSALCTKLPANYDQAVLVYCRRAANGAYYQKTGNYVLKNKRSYAYCASGDVRTGYRTTAGSTILS
jgi:hypothetical protein